MYGMVIIFNVIIGEVLSLNFNNNFEFGFVVLFFFDGVNFVGIS